MSKKRKEKTRQSGGRSKAAEKTSKGGRSKTKKGDRSFFKDVSRESHERPNEVKETRGKQPQRRKEDRRRGEVGDADVDDNVRVQAKSAFSAS